MKPYHNTEDALAALRSISSEVSFEQVAVWVEKARANPLVRRDRAVNKWIYFLNWNRRN